MSWLRSLAVGLALAFGGAGCAQLGLVGDGTSVSVGWTSGGTVIDPARMPEDGEGFWTPPTWKLRGARYGADELVDLLAGVGRRFAVQFPRSRLAVGDLSTLRGGDAPHHRSHQSGRDVDLVLFYTDLAGRALVSDTMHVFDAEGNAIGAPVKLDVARSWAVVRALITAPEAEVQRIFFNEPLIQRVLDHARATGEPALLVERARELLKQPSDSAPHNDHMHVRIFCPAADLPYGCVDTGYLDGQGKEPPRLAALTPAQREVLGEAMPAMLALVGWSALR